MTLAERLNSGTVSFTAWSGVPDTLTVESVSRLGFEVVTLDMQHGAHHEDSVARCIPSITGPGKHSVIRIPVGRFDMASRALDLGAEAVIAPMINSVADARRFAAAMKYPPVGERSWGPTFGFPRSGVKDHAEWLATQNARTISFAMIETRSAYGLLNEILDVPGIDGIFVGPSDFSIAWTNGAALNPNLEDMMGAVADIGGRARKAGKFAAIFATDPAICGRYASMGYQMIAMGNEQTYMRVGAENLIAAARAAIG
ncbi:HpcH/HpaI aldolase/citrate lyase family protein [Mesorhizobium sp. J428]|uniref:HpcH/HpaI aldolase family protein n=1 Tax=Mesorhizobium sp. J428 TaxID=2898440 RepID=UPI002150FD7F|nr:aldolase/citrate lyase family protein [Mesorhizobium sp. J428]MCR5859968.1 aldolase/citrate lyase family protein [Mesorhizobium sp. J428]